MSFLQRIWRPPVLVGIGVGAVTLPVAYLLTRRMWMPALIAAIVLLLIVGLIAVILILLKRLHEQQTSDEIERTIHRQADRQIDRSMVGEVAAAQNLKTELLSGLERLRNSSMGRKNGKGFLARMPWYLVIGPTEAGKSTLLKNSDLPSPVTEGGRQPIAVGGTGGTRNFQWWLSEEGVFLELAGRRFKRSEFDDDEEWIEFLQTLKKRRSKAINGLIIVASLSQLADRPEADVDLAANAARDRVQELVRHLGIVFPVYVVFTGLDRVDGFADFFGSLDEAERAKAWGATIPVAQARTVRAQALFDNEFRVLTGALEDVRDVTVPKLADPAARSRAYTFPAQMESLRPVMRRFIRTLFAPDPRQEAPLFRGFFFTSAEGQGASSDRVLTPVAKSLGNPLPAAPRPQPASAGWFVHDLVLKVVLGDSRLVIPTQATSSAQWRLRVAVVAGLGGAFIALAIVLSALSCSNVRVLHRVQVAADSAAAIAPHGRLVADVQILDRLRQRVEELENREGAPKVSVHLAPSAADRVRKPSEQLLVRQTIENLIAPAVDRMDKDLAHMTQSGQGSPLDFYETFHAYRLLTKSREGFDPQRSALVSRRVVLALTPDVGAESQADQDSFKLQVPRLIRFLSSHPVYLGGEITIADFGDPSWRKAAEQRLAQTWSTIPFYDQLVAANPLPAWTFEKLAGPPALLNADASVPGVYCAKAWKNTIRPQIEALDSQTRDWVMESTFNGNPPGVRDNLLQSYASHFERSWITFLESVHLTSRFSSPDQMSGMIETAMDKDSQLFKFLDAVNAQTELGVGDGPLAHTENEFKLLHEFSASAKERAAGSSSGYAQKIEAVAAKWFGGGHGGSDISVHASNRDNYVKLLSKLHEKLQDPAAASGIENDIKGWIDGMVADYNGTEGAKAISTTLLLPCNKVFVNGDQQQVRAKIKAIQDAWVVLASDYQSLAGKYPLARNSSAYMTNKEFSDFFGPSGKLEAFRQSSLATVISEDGAALDPKIAVNPAVLEAFRKAALIRKCLFSTGALGAGFRVRGNEPAQSGLIIHKVSLWAGGTPHNYENENRELAWRQLDWPGTDPSADARVMADNFAIARANAGLWSLFRLLDMAQYGRSPDGYASYTWHGQAGSTPIQLTWEFRTGDLPPEVLHPSSFLNFRLPSTFEANPATRS